METLNSTITKPETVTQQLVGRLATLPGLALVALLAALLTYHLSSPPRNEPPSLPETIPFVSNGWLYAVDAHRFMEKARRALRQSNIVQFRFGLRRMYLLTGSQNVAALFKTTPDIRNEKMMEMVMATMWNMPDREVEVFRRDKSGRGRVPAAGTEGMPWGERHWAINHHLYDKYLLSAKYSTLMGQKYYEVFSRKLEAFPQEQWSTIRLMNWFKKDMAEAALESLVGPSLLALNPDYLDAFWDMDKVTFQIAFGVPRWLRPRPWKLRDRVHAMTRKYIEAAWANFDWKGPHREAHWEEHFGARISRELARWLRENFCLATQAGLNSNTIPTATWALFELIKNPTLLQAVKSEVQTAYTTKDPKTGAPTTIDVQKLISLPLLQAVYVETMRLHVSMSLLREVAQPFVMDGYRLEKHALLLAPNAIAHTDEAAWGVEGHPATEFWPGRHVKYVETRDADGDVVGREAKFVLGGRPSSFFPYGGGVSICPGRNFAKQEILLTIAILITRFDIEFVEWTHLDGSTSDRPAEDNIHFVGSAAMPPDRDMKIRWKRLW